MSTEHAPILSSRVQLFMGISLSIGSVSTLATSLAFYWFVKIKRSFRHDLIMLLIQADFVQSVAYVICPIVQFSRGPVLSNSTFCQTSGFFLALGIEASDVAVLLIAVHSAMYIHRPRSGLYPYRRWAYAAYVGIPIILASLSFANGGYENLGAYCYLSRDHGWSRLALAWAPRYVLMSFLVITYAYIYIYVWISLGHYDSKGSSTQPSIGRSGRPSIISPQPGPFISSISGDNTNKTPQPPPSARGRAQAPTDDQHSYFPFAPDLAIPQPTVRQSTTTIVSYPSASLLMDGKSTLASATNDALKQATPVSLNSRWCDSIAAQQCPVLAVTDLPTIDLSSLQEELELDVFFNRERIRRQLKTLFVYPLIYVLTWIFPLINQVFGQIGAPKHLWISCLSILGFAVQGFANTVVFASREKPWRQTSMNGFLVAVRGKLLGGATLIHSGGPTRDDRMMEARIAMARRQGEILDETDAAVTSKTSLQLKGGIRNWWDTSEEDFDLERYNTNK